MSWKDDTIKLLQSLELTSIQKNKFKIKRLTRLIQLISEHSSECELCKNYQMSMERLLHKLQYGKVDKEYRCLLSLMRHHMITCHQYIQMGSIAFVAMVIGCSVGAFIGYYGFDHTSTGIVIGIFLGLLSGAHQEKRLFKIGKSI